MFPRASERLGWAALVRMGNDMARLLEKAEWILNEGHAGLRSFPGVPHRLERIRVRQGVSWYDDSKAPNYDAAEMALKALDGPLVVLAGVEAKQGEAGGWLEQLQRQAAAVVLYGQAREAFAQLLSAAGFDGKVQHCDGLAEAVPLADSLATACRCTGVLLSPACASFDQYRDFEARGDYFRELVERLDG